MALRLAASWPAKGVGKLLPIVGCDYGIVVEIHIAIRLRPQTDPACNRCREVVLQVELAIEIAFDLLTGDAHLEVVPCARRRWRIANPFDRGPFTLLELPEHEIVLEWIGAQRQVVAIGLQVKQNAGALIDAAGDALETQRDLAVAEIRHVLSNSIWKVGKRLHAVEELGIALAVQGPRLVGDAGGGLAFLPLAAVDSEDLVAAFGFNPPDADHVYKRACIGADCVVREVELQWLSRCRADQALYQCSP